MRTPHMIVNSLPLRERLQTHPTSVRVTPRARHVVAPLTPLNRHLASRTFLHIVHARPLLEQLIHTILPIGTGHPFVVFDVAVRAYSADTRRAANDGVAGA